METRPMNLAVGGNSIEQPLYGGGFALGKFVNKHAQSIHMVLKGALMILMVVFIVVLIQNTIADVELIQSEATLFGATAAYMNVAYHQGCKSRGACSRSCPFITEDDPRLIIGNQMDVIQELYEQTQQCVSDDTLTVANALDKIQDETKSTTARTTWQGILNVESGANQAIAVILNQLKTLNASFSQSSAINVALMDAKNKATALGAAASIQKNILIVASLHLNSQIMMQYIMNVSPEKQQKILDYDRRVAAAAMAANTSAGSISSIYATNSKPVANYAASYGVMDPAATTPSQDIIASMANLISEAQAGDNSIAALIAKLKTVSEIYNSCRKVVDHFSNDLPGKMTNDKMNQLIESNDYETAIIRTALEPDLVANHKKFAKERSSFESGGGIRSVRDDDNDVVPWVGIFGRPTYRKSNGKSVDANSGASGKDDVLKSIPSDDPNQLMRTSAVRMSTVTY